MMWDRSQGRSQSAGSGSDGFPRRKGQRGVRTQGEVGVPGGRPTRLHWKSGGHWRYRGWMQLGTGSPSLAQPRTRAGYARGQMVRVTKGRVASAWVQRVWGVLTTTSTHQEGE